MSSAWRPQQQQKTRSTTPSIRSSRSSYRSTATSPPPLAGPSFLHAADSARLSTSLLDLIALICREHVLTWYTASISTNRDIVPQITAIFVHVLQTLEVRLADVDFVELLLIDVVNLLEKHYEDFDNAVEKVGTSYGHNQSVGELFHGLQPHLAISLSTTSNWDPVVDKVYLRKVIEDLLKLLMPPEDYRAETERAIVKEIIVNVILGAVFDKVAKPWFMYRVVGDVLESVVHDRQELREEKEAKDEDGQHHFNVTTTVSILDTASSILASIPSTIVTFCSYISFLYTVSSVDDSQASTGPNLTLPSISLLLVVLPFSSFLIQLFHYARLISSLLVRRLNALATYAMYKRVLNIAMIEKVVEVASRSLFPNGHPPPHEPDPEEYGQEELRIRCERLLASLIPSYSLRFLLPATAPSVKRLAASRFILRPLSSHIANVHLFVLLLDLLVGAVFPELLLEPAFDDGL